MSQTAYDTDDGSANQTRFHVLGNGGSSGPKTGRVYWAHSQRGFAEALKQARHEDVLVSQDARWPARAVAGIHFHAPDLKNAPKLLITRRLGARTRAAYDAIFHQVVDPGFAKLLHAETLREVLSARNRADLIIGGLYIEDAESLLLYRGTLEPVLVRVSWFKARTGGPRPDFARLSFEDYGQTVRLGQYEASTDAILYEHDPDYRKRAKKRLRRQDPSLGGSIRRLRLQKGLKQSDFSDIPARTIGRIERGIVENPHEDTLARIASSLGVAVDDLDTY